MKQITPALLLLAISVTTTANAEKITLQMADQKGGMRAVLEAAGKLQNLPYNLRWAEFPAAAPLGEALNAGAVDAGFIGDAPLLFAEAGGARVKAIAVAKSDAYGTALLVNAGSPLTSAASLKGKSIATNRGSIGQFVALKALAAAGLSARDVTFRFLDPADAKLALIRGSVDVWATWEPYTAFAETQDHLRVLVNGRGLWSGNTFVAATDSALANPEKRRALQDFLHRLSDAQQWANQHPDSYSQTLSKIIGFPQDAVKLSFERRHMAWQPIDAQTVAQQQQTADFYHQSGLLPVALQVAPTFDYSFTLSGPAGGKAPDASRQQEVQ
ncbi:MULTISPECIES: ABC transporter substrate-binding protein [Tatumella]|uniref:ABC transporter substrate-binding protein n=1 Tax=Tatumella punctata TaxID=399969 RepID=A0ABW1VJM0_9GAMM|nr:MULTISPECIES: ABC transporter substrate-binding protein [unclassified Tatumella]MBS0857634.1 ABC transporter substrate-binding protein [Tatumella sp. JGM16]MBS0895456.1 ABC transporter substrate-binding protein [Tatumella sp. JGM130]MBS0914335.1 ABC transporter substrate-binding protein [Tatumella sp. JGM91]